MTVAEPHRYPRATSARVLAAAFDLVVGARLLFPDDSLGSSPGYRIARQTFFGDVPFGLVLLVLGAVMAAGLASDRWPRVVQAVTWASALTWLLFAVDLALVNIGQIGTFAYGLIAALNGYAIVHLVLWQRQLERDNRGTGG